MTMDSVQLRLLESGDLESEQIAYWSYSFNAFFQLYGIVSVFKVSLGEGVISGGNISRGNLVTSSWI